MGNSANKYPFFRKYKGIDVWFEIKSSKEFVELKKVGNTWVKATVKASLFPEKQFIQDMLNCHENRWEVVDEVEFKLIQLKFEADVR